MRRWARARRKRSLSLPAAKVWQHRRHRKPDAACHPGREGVRIDAGTYRPDGSGIVHRRTVGQYSVEVRTLRAPSGVWKSAYIVEPAIHAGPRDFVMITLLEEFEDERLAVDAAMERGISHADWLDAARTTSAG